MNIQAQIKKTIIETVKEVYEMQQKNVLSFDDFCVSFEKLWNSEVSRENKKEKNTPEITNQQTQGSSSKKPRKKTVIEESARCFALKKDGGRCAAKAYTGGMNPKLCTLHNNKGANFGIHQDTRSTESQYSETVLPKQEINKTVEAVKPTSTVVDKKGKKPVLSDETCLLSDNEEEILSEPEIYDEKELFGDVDSDNEDCLF
jgi:hypothetical protein